MRPVFLSVETHFVASLSCEALGLVYGGLPSKGKGQACLEARFSWCGNPFHGPRFSWCGNLCDGPIYFTKYYEQFRYTSSFSQRARGKQATNRRLFSAQQGLSGTRKSRVPGQIYAKRGIRNPQEIVFFGRVRASVGLVIRSLVCWPYYTNFSVSA